MPLQRELEQYLEPEEIAQRLRVHPRTVVRWIRAGRLSRARRIGARSWRVPVSAVAAFLEGCPHAG